MSLRSTTPQSRREEGRERKGERGREREREREREGGRERGSETETMTPHHLMEDLGLETLFVFFTIHAVISCQFPAGLFPCSVVRMSLSLLRLSPKVAHSRISAVLQESSAVCVWIRPISNIHLMRIYIFNILLLFGLQCTTRLKNAFFLSLKGEWIVSACESFEILSMLNG